MAEAWESVGLLYYGINHTASGFPTVVVVVFVL